jgi:hypothetical protein
MMQLDAVICVTCALLMGSPVDTFDTCMRNSLVPRPYIESRAWGQG